MFYAIDLHSNNFIVAKRDNKSKIITKKYNLFNNEIENFKSILLKDDVIAIESMFNSYYFYDQISPLVKKVKIINPGKFKIISESSCKTDKQDARTILEFLEKDMIPEIPVPTKEIRELRSLFTTYQILLKQKVMYKNRIYSLIRGNGLFLTKKDMFCILGKQELKNVIKTKVSKITKIQVAKLLYFIDNIEKEIEEIKQNILTFSKYFIKEINLLMTLPGINMFSSLGIIADIGDINNFVNPKKLCSYLVLSPKTKESNDKRKNGSLAKHGRKLARNMISQAIFHIIRTNKVYKDYYEKKKKQKGVGKTLVALERRLCVIIFHMLKNNETYRYFQEKSYGRKLKECMKYINEIRSMDENFLKEWEEEVRKKYDVKYHKREKIKNIA